MKILHITYDLRDRSNREKTTAVRNLIDQTGKIAEIMVIDLLRVSKLKEEYIKIKSNDHFIINSFGLPYGLFLKGNLYRVYNKLLKESRHKSIFFDPIDVIHAHKLTYEGFIGYLLASKLNKPLFVTLRQTDFWVLKYKLNLHSIYKEVLRTSSKIFYIVPYMVKSIKKIFGNVFFDEHIKSKLVFLPNIVIDNTMNMDISYEKGSLLTVLRMTKESVRRKNIKKLFKAMQMIKNNNVHLNVIGDGEYINNVKSWTKKYKITNKINFIGAVTNSEMGYYYSRAHAFVMPSYSESFGMVYAESLLYGTPILYSHNTGFDGMFDNVGIAVDPYSTKSIAEGLAKIVENNEEYRKSIADLKKMNAFQFFQPCFSRNTYAECLNTIN